MVRTGIMKTLVILGLLFAYVQATSEPVSITELVLHAITTCVQENNVDVNKLEDVMSQHGLPTDNPELIKFFPCYWREVGIITSDGTFNHHQTQIVFSELLRQQYPNVANPDKITEDAVNHCKENIRGDSLVMKGISYRNCLQQYIQQELA